MKLFLLLVDERCFFHRLVTLYFMLRGRLNLIAYYRTNHVNIDPVDVLEIRIKQLAESIDRRRAKLQTTVSQKGAELMGLSRTIIGVQANMQLQSWQTQKLKQAAKIGRRHVSIEKLCKDVELTRPEVIQWLKDNPVPLEEREPLPPPPSAQPASNNNRSRPNPTDAWGDNTAPLYTTDSDNSYSSEQQSRQRQQQQRYNDPNLPPWKRYAKDKSKIGRQAEATLEMIYSKTEWPSDAVVESMWDLHKIRKEDVVQWFVRKRKQNKQPRGRGGSVKRSQQAPPEGTPFDGAE